jgi:hypothetical protein
MTIPAIMYVHAASQALPIVAALGVRGRQQPVPYHRVVIWCLVLLATDAVDLTFARLHYNNLWTGYFTRPLELGMSLWILSDWQPNESLRLTYNLAIPITGTVVASLLVLTDPSVTFYRWIAPLLGLLALVASVHTLAHRTLLSRVPLTDQGWFWICLGMSLFWLGDVSVPVFADAFVVTHETWVHWAYMGRAYTDIAAFGLMAWGILRSRVPTWSGFSSARA